MPKKSSSTKKKSSSVSTSSSSNSSSWTSLKQAGETLEQMQTLHLFLLLFLTVMATLLMTKVVKQDQELRSLQFRLDFMTDRYHSERSKLTSSMMEDQEEAGAEQAPLTDLQF